MSRPSYSPHPSARMAPGLSHSSPKMPTGPSESDLRRLQMEQESSGVRRAVEEEVKRNVNREFETLLDSLQVPAATRLKLEPLDTPVKDALLRNSRLSKSSAEALLGASNNPSSPLPFLRKAQSGLSLRPPSNQRALLPSQHYPPPAPPRHPSTLASTRPDDARRTSGTRKPSGQGLAPHPYAHAQAGRSRNVTPIRGDAVAAALDVSGPSSRSSAAHSRGYHDGATMADGRARASLRAPRLVTSEMLVLGLPLPSPAFAREGKKASVSSRSQSSSTASRPASPSRSSFGRSFFGGGGGKGSKPPPQSPSSAQGSFAPKRSSKGGRTESLDVQHVNQASSSSTRSPASGKSTPDAWARFLGSHAASELDVARTKTLRMLLRHESAQWVERWLNAGGFEALLSRLQELIDAEWRDDLHDEQLFIELLRCMKALTTSEAGKTAIRWHSARPLRDLFRLLYSEKRPGDIATRQLIVELAHSMFDIYPDRQGHRVPPSGQNVQDGRHDIYAFVLSLLDSAVNERVLDADEAPTRDGRRSRPHNQIICPASELDKPKLELHDFVAAAHKPRIYKAYLTQLQEICRDFFWVMSHGENGIWSLADVDESKIRPQAPTGATGSVEYEAVDYLTAHFRLINAIARGLAERDAADEDDGRFAGQRGRRAEGVAGAGGRAWRFHADLMASGMDRTLCTVRKASIEHYAAFHVEVARYVHLAAHAVPPPNTSSGGAGRSVVPYPVERLITLPPGHLRRQERELERARRTATTSVGGGGGGNAPFLQPQRYLGAQSQEHQRQASGHRYPAPAPPPSAATLRDHQHHHVAQPFPSEYRGALDVARGGPGGDALYAPARNDDDDEDDDASKVMGSLEWNFEFQY